jgi:hypothetical protein
MAGVATDVVEFQLLKVWLWGEDIAKSAPKRAIFYTSLKRAPIGRLTDKCTFPEPNCLATRIGGDALVEDGLRRTGSLQRSLAPLRLLPTHSVMSHSAPKGLRVGPELPPQPSPQLPVAAGPLSAPEQTPRPHGKTLLAARTR